MPGSWSKNFGWSPSGDGAVPSKSPPGAAASDGQLIGSLPLGFDLAEDHVGDGLAGLGAALVGHQHAFAFSAGPSPTGRPAITTTITGLPVASSALISACWSGGSAGAGLSPSPSA